MSAYNAQVALITEHLHYPPLTLIDELINAVNEVSNRAIDHLETYLLSLPADKLGFYHTPTPANSLPETDDKGNLLFSEAAETELRQGVHKLETLLQGAIDRNFDKFEIYALRNLFTLPTELVPFLRLGHHEVQGIDFEAAAVTAHRRRRLQIQAMEVDAPPDNTPGIRRDENGEIYYHPTKPNSETVGRLRQRLLDAQAKHTQLSKEAAANAKLLMQLRSIFPPLTPSSRNSSSSSSSSSSATTTDSGSSGSRGGSVHSLTFLPPTLLAHPTLQPLPSTASFVTTQTSSLAQTLATVLSPFLQTIPESPATPPPTPPPSNFLDDINPTNPSAPPMMEQRARYIEKNLRRHFEKQRRQKLTSRGELIGGEFWDGVVASEGDSRGVRRRTLEEVKEIEAVAATIKGEDVGEREERPQTAKRGGKRVSTGRGGRGGARGRGASTRGRGGSRRSTGKGKGKAEDEDEEEKEEEEDAIGPNEMHDDDGDAEMAGT